MNIRQIYRYEVAQRRSLRLLQRHLSSEQKESLKDKSIIKVEGSHGGRYEIKRSQCSCEICLQGRIMIVSVRAEGQHTYCIAAHEHTPRRSFPSTPNLPWPDQVLAFKLAIETDEPDFLKTVDRSGSLC